MINYIVAVTDDNTITPLCWCKTLDDAVTAIRQRYGHAPYALQYLIISYDHHDILNVNYDGQVLTLN